MSRPSRTPRTPPTITDIQQFFDEMQRRLDLICRVLQKFPKETVPNELLPFFSPSRIASARPSFTEQGVIVLQLERLRAGTRTAMEFPAEWMDMQPSKLAAEIRDRYWAGRGRASQRQLSELQKLAQAHDLQAEHHLAEAKKTRARLDALRNSKQTQPAQPIAANAAQPTQLAHSPF